MSSSEETLEADWVSVRPHVFEEPHKSKFVFIVAWNEEEDKFAVTCHNRTAQRRRSGSRGSPLRAVPGEPEAPGEADEEECSWAGLFSSRDLRAVHQQLCAVSAELEPCLPPLPAEPAGVWAVLFGAPEPPAPPVEGLCHQLQLYLGHALDTCGWKILSRVLFSESGDPEEYYESLSELRREGYEEVLQRARRQLQQLLEKHKNTESMVELLDLYQLEDEAYSNLAEATTELYQYLLQPFRDMRELAMLRRQQIKISLENDYLGPRRIESLTKEDADWQRKAHTAVLSIQDLTVKFFEITSKAQKAVLDRMRADQKKYGKASWAVAVDRMEKLQYAVSKETLQLMRAKEVCLEQRKHALKEEMQSLQGGAEALALLDQLEADYYDHQLQLYEVQFEILKFEELLLTAQLESIKRQISEKRNEVVYYDTYESVEAMFSIENMAASLHLQQEELKKLEQKVRHMESRRGRISAKKAYLRNKKDICIAKHSEKNQQRLQSDEGYRKHHSVQIKRDQLQDDEEKKTTLFSQERQKTLDRLRMFKQRYPGQVILKSTRLRLAHSRRKGLAYSMDEPQSLQVTKNMQQANERDQPREVASALEVQPLGCLPRLEDAALPLTFITSLDPEMTPRSFPKEDRLESEWETCRQSCPPPPAPPPPPPPPPLPAKEDPTDFVEKGVSTVKKEKVDTVVLNSTSLPSAHHLDSGQLLNARRKLKKTEALEGGPRRRASSPMDEVLASLKRGSFHLRKAEQRSLPPYRDEDDSNNILAQIRKGVKLKKVQTEVLRESFTLLPDTDPLTRSIHEALRRIKEASPESEDEEESLPCTDWEN
ncbi:junction-mediating and -regulatory protein isoform X1 [Lissotriton helveticus]